VVVVAPPAQRWCHRIEVPEEIFEHLVNETNLSRDRASA